MKKIVIAPDSFKESMTALQACQAIQRGIRRVLPDVDCVLVPMADGGEGTVDAFLTALNGQQISCRVEGPLADHQVESYFGLIDDGCTAVIEMAKANGIELLPPTQRNPWLTSSYGTGQMIRQALDLGVSKIIIGLGGSVTNDGGAGMAQALGAKFYDIHGEALPLGGGYLGQLTTMDLTQLDPRLQQIEMIIASDVNNPLCGEQGASYIFAPQKGASPEMVQQLDAHLCHFADVVETQLQLHVKHCAGTGAAGGLGFGLMAFTGAQMQSGAQLLIQHTQLAQQVSTADCLITGEGKLDAQTQLGKTPWAVAQLATPYQIPVIAFAGCLGQGFQQLYQHGFHRLITISPQHVTLAYALEHAQDYLQQAAAQWAQQLKEQKKCRG